MDIYEVEKKIYEDNGNSYNAYIDDKKSKYNGLSVYGVSILVESDRVLIHDGVKSFWIKDNGSNFRVEVA